MKAFLRRLWLAIKPDPYFHIANTMILDGYTDLEIALEIHQLRESSGDKFPQQK